MMTIGHVGKTVVFEVVNSIWNWKAI